MRKNIQIPYVAITDIKTVEQLNYCSQFCSVDQLDDKVQQFEIDEALRDGDTICFDNGEPETNFFFWDLKNSEKRLSKCIKFTFNEFKRHVKSLGLKSVLPTPADAKIKMYYASLTSYYKGLDDKDTSSTEELFCADSIKSLMELIVLESKLPEDERDELVINTKYISEEEYNNLPDYNG